MKQTEKIMTIGKAILISYGISMIMLFLLSIALWKIDLNEKILIGAFIVIYIISSFVGGMYCGKIIKNRKYLWGMLSGFLYCIVLFIVSVFTNGMTQTIQTMNITTICLCLLSGMLGGMIS